MGVSHIVAQKRVYYGGMVEYGRVAYLRGGGIFWEGGVDSERAG